MALFSGIEKLINEHGSSVILKERISLANDKHSLLKDKCSCLEKNILELNQKVDVLKSENKAFKLDIKKASNEVCILKDKINKTHNENPDNYVCDHCGGHDLKRTGSRKDPTFGVLGVKQKIYSCQNCQKESAFTQD